MMRRYSILLKFLLVVALFLFVACFQPNEPDPDVVVTVQEPPDVGRTIVMGTFISLENYGYEQDELFFSGTAHSYVNTSALTSDGKWNVEAAEEAKYKTRMIIYKPTDPAKFNGTVIMEWINVTAGMDVPTCWVMMHTEIMRRGYAYVGISAQYVGVEGGETMLPTPLGRAMPLKTLAPRRYRSLSHPGDSFSYDIFAQAAQAIRNPTDIAPLGDLTAERLIAAGESQSAMRLVTFVNILGKSTDAIDGYLIYSRMGYVEDFGGASAALSESPQAEIYTPAVIRVRDDLGKPVLNFQTETDVFRMGALSSRQSDSETFRLWEVAGTAHADAYSIITGMTDKGDDVATAEIMVTHTPNIIMEDCVEAINSAPQHHFAVKAALYALHRWLAYGTLPTSAPRLESNNAGDDAARDQYGNALGGIRSPYMDAPIARLSGDNADVQTDDGNICFLFGATEMLDDAVLQTLYPSHSAYVNAVTASANEAVAKGFLLSEDAALIISAAEAGDIPPQ